MTLPSYLQSIFLIKYSFNWSELILQSVNLVFIHYHIFITFCLPIWLERRRGFPGNHPPDKANVVLQDLRSHQRKDHKHFQHIDGCTRLHLSPGILSVFCTSSFHYRNSLAPSVGTERKVMASKRNPTQTATVHSTDTDTSAGHANNQAVTRRDLDMLARNLTAAFSEQLRRYPILWRITISSFFFGGYKSGTVME